MMARQKIFGEGFRAFQLHRTFGWAKNVQAGSLECIHYTRDQRRFRADNRQVNLFALGECNQRRDIHHANIHIL